MYDSVVMLHTNMQICTVCNRSGKYRIQKSASRVELEE